MLANSISLTLGSDTLVLKRINQDNNASTYFGRVGATTDVTMSVKHTFPRNRVTPGNESHLVRFDLDVYDATTKQLLRRNSVWTVMQVASGIQDSVQLKQAYELITEFMTSDNIDAILGRES